MIFLRLGCNMHIDNVSGRYRKFSCITYLNEEQINNCLSKHKTQMRAYAFRLHDKDTKEDGTLKEPHTHLIIITHNACTLSAVRRWFDGFIKDGKEITTTAQYCTDVYQAYKYLTHSTAQAIADGKYRYDDSFLRVYNAGYFQADEESSFDNIQLCVNMAINGSSLDDIFRVGGRDLIIHWNNTKSFIKDLSVFKTHNFNSFAELFTYEDIMKFERGNYNENG